MSGGKDVRGDSRAPGECWVKTVDDLLELIDEEEPVAASLTIEQDGRGHIFSVVNASGEPVFLEGEGDYAPTLERLVARAKVVNIGIITVSGWPPCPDPRLCEPGVAVRQQRHLNALLATVRPGKPEPNV